jgi:hypothetical protein
MPGSTPPDPGLQFLLALLRETALYAEARAAGGDARAAGAAAHVRSALTCLGSDDGGETGAAPDEG